MDNVTKAKSNVLEKLIEMMEEKMVYGLKEKSPKFAKIQIESDDPEVASELKDKVLEGVKEQVEPEEENEQQDQWKSPEGMKELLKAKSEERMEQESEEPEEPEESDEDLRRLMDMYNSLK